MSHRLVLILLAILLPLSGNVRADVTLIHAGELLAVPGKAPLRNQTIIVEGDRITGIEEVTLVGSNGWSRTSVRCST